MSGPLCRQISNKIVIMSTLVSGSDADRFVDVSKEVAGDRLRSVTYFTKDDFEQLFLREDLERGADLTTFIGLEWRESDITENAYQGTELGEHQFTLRRFDNGYLLRVACDRAGVFVTVDGLSLDRFDELAAELDEILESMPG